jgi:hypothetical protein
MNPNRRNFLKNVTAASALLATESIAKPFNIIKDLKKVSPNDKIRFRNDRNGDSGAQRHQSRFAKYCGRGICCCR